MGGGGHASRGGGGDLGDGGESDRELFSKCKKTGSVPCSNHPSSLSTSLRIRAASRELAHPRGLSPSPQGRCVWQRPPRRPRKAPSWRPPCPWCPGFQADGESLGSPQEEPRAATDGDRGERTWMALEAHGNPGAHAPGHSASGPPALLTTWPRPQRRQPDQSREHTCPARGGRETPPRSPPSPQQPVGRALWSPARLSCCQDTLLTSWPSRALANSRAPQSVSPGSGCAGGQAHTRPAGRAPCAYPGGPGPAAPAAPQHAPLTAGADTQFPPGLN